MQMIGLEEGGDARGTFENKQMRRLKRSSLVFRETALLYCGGCLRHVLHTLKKKKKVRRRFR